MECASPLAAACPNCGFANLPGAKFCSQCATPLAAGTAPAIPAVPVVAQAQESGAERRLVSVLFADLVGFTPFAEERDAEDVRDTLTRYFDLARELIERYGGTVEKFIGDAVMAVWGAPTAREDDAERAVRAALDLVGEADPTYPLQKKRHTFEYLREIAHLRPRTNTFGAVGRIKSKIAYAIHKYYQERGFFYVHTPLISSSDCEGAGDLFRVTTLDRDPVRRQNTYQTLMCSVRQYLASA